MRSMYFALNLNKKAFQSNANRHVLQPPVLHIHIVNVVEHVFWGPCKFEHVVDRNPI